MGYESADDGYIKVRVSECYQFPLGDIYKGEVLYKGEKHRQSAVVYKKTYKECCEGTREILMNELKTLKARQKNITAMLKAIDESENEGGKK